MSKFISIKNCIFNRDRIVSIEHSNIESEFQIFKILIRLDDSSEYKLVFNDSDEMLNVIRDVTVKLCY